MAKKSESIRFVTPIGVAVYPKISSPDTTGKFPDGKYKTDVDFGDDTDALIEKFKKAAKEWGAPMNLPVREEKDKEGKLTGRKLIRFKSKYRPAVFDAKKNEIPAEVKIGGGTKLRIDATLFAYTEGKGGVALRLGPTQVIELVESDSAANFDEVDGFEYEADDNDRSSAADAFDRL